MLKRVIKRMLGIPEPPPAAVVVKPAQKYKDMVDVDPDSVLMDDFSLSVRKPTPGKKYVRVGKDCMLSGRIIFETPAGEVIFGNSVFLGGAKIICRSRIEFGDNIFVAWGVYLYDHDSHSTDFRERRKDLAQQMKDYRAGRDFIENKNWDVVKSAPIKVGNDVWVGMEAVILKGVTIGEGAIIAARSVVTKDVPPWSIVAGNPAQVVRELPKELRYS